MPRRSFLERLQKKFLRRISFKLAAVICLLASGLVLMLGVSLTAVTQNVLKVTVKNSHREIAVRAAREVALFVSRPVEILRTAGELIGRMHADAWNQETVLVELALDFPMFEEIVSVDRKGRQIASSNPGYTRKDLSGERSYQQSIRGITYFSDIGTGEDHLPHLTLAIPYYETGKAAGALIAKVNVRGLWEIVDGIQIGESGRAFLITSTGLVVAHPDKTKVFRNADFRAYPDFQRIVSGKIGSLDYSDKNKRYLTSYAPVRGAVPLFIVIQREAGEAYALLGQMRFLIWSVLFVSLFMAAGVSIFLSKRLVLPIRSLERWSKKVALGDFEYRVAPKSLDEIGRLFIMFKRMSERLKQARDKEKLAALGIASTTISHKLKNSIVSLKTFAQLLPHRKADSRFMQRFENNFSSTVDHLEKMFKNLSLVASSGKPKLEPVNLGFVLDSMGDSLLETMERMGIGFQLEIQQGLPVIHADKDQLRELFVNLLQNSIQAMPKGGFLLIKAHAVPNSGGLEVTISDTGCGIAKQNLGKIFKPFFSTKHGGMGLGLTICKKIADDHGGTLSAVSVEEKGSVFTLRLPAAGHKKVFVQDPFFASSF